MEYRSQSSIKSNSSVPEEKFEAIEKRQLEILDKLTHLREMISEIHRKYLNESEKNATIDRSVGGIHDYIDIVVNANPSSPPFSLLFLHKLLREYYGDSIRLNSHVHSSITEPLNEYLSIFHQLEKRSVKNTTPSRPLILITLIWKSNQKKTELMVNPFRQSSVYGEGNTARFLSRLIPPIFPLNYDTLDWNTLSLVDGFIKQALDSHTFSLDMVENYLKARNNTGGPFLLGGISIADFVTFSSIAKIILANVNSANLSQHPNLRKWIDTCQRYGEFELFNMQK